jgi:cephalosporin-C deacetylase
MKKSILLILGFLWAWVGICQPTVQPIQIVITPNHDNWQYQVGEPVSFSITVWRNNIRLSNQSIRYEIGPEKMKPEIVGNQIAKPSVELKGGTLSKPGFLRCVATTEWNGKTYRSIATVGFQPEQIQSVASTPTDFDAFWNEVKLQLQKTPIDARLTPMPEKGTENVDVFHVNLQNIGNSRWFGMLAVPKKAGKYPAVLQVPGAGVRPYAADTALAEKGLIVFTVGIHGIPVNMDPAVYSQLASGALSGYFFSQAGNKDRYYYKRVYAGCLRAVDFISSLSTYNGKDLAVMGNSQGGALSMVTAGLDSRISCLAAIHPALCDLNGYVEKRAGGWPHIFNESNRTQNNQADLLNSLPFYDVVNFAKRIQQPGWYTWGFNDETCPPTSMYAAYNDVKAPKTLYLMEDTGHWIYPEQRQKMIDWILTQFKH